MIARGAAFTASITGGANDRLLTFKAPAERQRASFRWHLDEGNFLSAITMLRDQLTDFRQLAGDSLHLDKTTCNSMICKLHKLAKRLSYGLFQGKRLSELQAFVHARLAVGRASQRERVIEVSTDPSSVYPFELLALLPSNGFPPSSPERFLGLSAIVRRRLRRVDESNQKVLPNIPSLPLSFFWHSSLSGAALERTFLGTISDLVDIYGPWPSAKEKLDPLIAVQHLMDSRQAIDKAGHPTRTASQIIHFACHSDTFANHPDQYALELYNVEPCNIELGALKEYVSGEVGDINVGSNPILFLNSCGSAVADSQTRVSFPQFFLRHGFSVVIGTECDIPDSVAAHFSERFYGGILRGMSAGESLNAAKRHLLDAHNNPLGLLYVIYGDPDVRLKKRRLKGVFDVCRYSG